MGDLLSATLWLVWHWVRLMKRFEEVFPIVTLAMFGPMIPIMLGVAAIVLSIDDFKRAAPSSSPLPVWFVEHPKIFATIYLGTASVAVIASLGMLKKRKWAHTIWIGLVALGLIWTVVVIGSVGLQVFSVCNGLSPSLSVIDVLSWAPGVLLAVGMLALAVVVLRKLVSTWPSSGGQSGSHGF